MPLVRILTSAPFLVTLMSHFSYEWMMSVYDDAMPEFFLTILNINMLDVRKNFTLNDFNQKESAM